jgi:hypothetical protein
LRRGEAFALRSPFIEDLRISDGGGVASTTVRNKERQRQAVKLDLMSRSYLTTGCKDPNSCGRSRLERRVSEGELMLVLGWRMRNDADDKLLSSLPPLF